MILGVKNKACNACWKTEYDGGYSYRMKSNLNSSIDTDLIDEAIKNNGHISSMPKYIALKVGNLCNLKCIMCQQISSSKIEEEIEELKSKNIKLPKLWNLIDIEKEKVDIKLRNFNALASTSTAKEVIQQLEPAIRTCHELELIGGEAFVNPFTIELINYCIKKNIAGNISVSMISNFTLLNKKQLGLLKHFKKITLVASYDHVDKEKLRYIRFPTDYKKFKENFELIFNNEKIELKISVTFSILNILDFDIIFDEFIKISNRANHCFTVNCNLVTQPDYLDPRYLEEYQKEELIERINQYLIKNKECKLFKDNESLFQYFQHMSKNLSSNPGFEDIVKERTRVLELLDKTRKTNYKKLFPFIKEYK